MVSVSPIIQDGKLVGAVTHVFVNDPTKGYGIFIYDMIKKRSVKMLIKGLLGAIMNLKEN